jgi:uroporphyrinogen decarboxylase
MSDIISNINNKNIPPFVLPTNIAKDAKKIRTAYDITPDAPLFQTEFGYYCLDRWKEQGLNDDIWKQFGYDGWAQSYLSGCGGCEMTFYPSFETKVLEDRGEHELVLDHAGRKVLYFKNRRNGFMPEYVDHPVKDLKSWENDIKWRMDPETPERKNALEAGVKNLLAAQEQGIMIGQYIIGGYMYLRSLIGPLELPYMFYDKPELIHECMKQWLLICDSACEYNQKYFTFDEILFDEDICYNHGSLISPDMINEFLFPYYQQLLTDCKKRQLDKSRKLFVHLATDGFCYPVIPLYKKLGFNVFSPFEVASNCNVVEIGQKYPDIIIKGGVDKRILAQGKKAIDEMIEKIFIPMRKRGGYIPTCDHGVPEEVSLENYIYYRKRAIEF